MAVVFLYNQTIKEQFLNSLTPSVCVRYTQIFNQVSDSIEQPRNKDVAEMSIEELRRGFDGFEYIDVDAARPVLYAMQTYNRWAHDTRQSLAFTDALEVFNERTDVDYTIGIRSSILPSPEVLVSRISSVYPIDEGYELLPALIFAWLGIPQISGAAKVRNEDVNFVHHRLLLQDGSVYPYDIPEVFWEPLEVYAKTKEAVRHKLNDQTVKPIDHGFFIKKFKTENAKVGLDPYTPKELSNRIGNLLLDVSPERIGNTTINYTTVFKSGVFYRLYQYELSGANLYAKENKDKVLSIANKKSFKDVMTVYEAYRAVFYPRS